MSLRTSDFDYELPPGLIAQEPSGERGESRLLVVPRPPSPVPRSQIRDAGDGRGTGHGGRFIDANFSELPNLIPAGDLLVLNTTRVRHARLIARRPNAKPAEVLLIHPAPKGHWIAMGKPGSALQKGKRVQIGPEQFIETVAVREDGYREVRFIGITAEAAMRAAGRLPLPPYITRDPTSVDEDRYQTVYADREGSVAAPTAGLHFTPDLLARLRARGVRIAHLDLEVGPGTFRPVEVEDPSRHPMHGEKFEIPAETAAAIQKLRARKGRLWAVGTTVVRALESAATRDGEVKAGARETRLMITPGHEFKVVERLITNFHLPRSTLLMLVTAFGGYRRIMDAYEYAVAKRYRFYSYGDAMLVL